MARKKTDDRLDGLKEIVSSPRKFIESYLYIITKNQTFEIIKLNKAQDELMTYIEECLAKNKPVRIRILKSRQHGISTFVMALMFWVATMNRYKTCALVAHKEDSTRGIFDKARIFYENLPKWMQPTTNRFSSEAISYDYPEEEGGKGKGGLKSSIFFGTAGGNELFRGKTITFLHKSEKAFWENPDLLNKSLNATVPYLPGTFIIDETTANGYNFFKDEWEKSKSGDNEYKPFFFGWDYDAGAVMPVEEGFEFLPCEIEYMLLNDLTREQMRWRRYTIVNSFGYSLKDIENDDIDDFLQEYPLHDHEAFIATGKSVFSQKVLQKGLAYANRIKPERYVIKSYPCNSDLMIFEKPEVKEKIIYDQKVEFNFEKKEYEYVDTDFIAGKKYYYANYVIGIDTSGLGADNNVISVWHTTTKRNVARWMIKDISEKNLAKVIVEIAKLYHNALLAPETNYSRSLIDYILELGYDNFYIKENVKRIDKQTQALEYGFQTTSVTKPVIVSYMKTSLNDDYTIIPDIEFWKEAEYYIQDRTKAGTETFNAASGYHDDIVMANMIARYVCDSMMANQGYTIRDEMVKTDSYEIGGVFIEKPNWIKESFNRNKKQNKFEKEAFRNNA
ncbi:MAG TPA: hypothetical protein PL042_06800 [Caldisericia bacterium]|jgi:hypothetical protein|nr:hypothetical protein [Caldisericia bacterium]